MDGPLVSVIVPTRNSEACIELCLRSIREQSYSKIETIVVDQESDDDTTNICRRYNAKVYPLPKPDIYSPPTKSRNKGSREANGKYLLHLDADMELQTSVIQECIEKCESSDVGAIVIHEVDVAVGYWAKCKALERSCYIGDQDMEAARFVSREIFEKIGGYDESLSAGEDWDIHHRCQNVTEIADIRARIKHHQGKIRLAGQLSKKYNYGRTFGSYIKKCPKKSVKQLSIFRAAYFHHWKSLTRCPMHAIGFLVMKVCEFIAGAIGYIRGGGPPRKS